MANLTEGKRTRRRRITKVGVMCALAMAAVFVPAARAEASVTFYELRAQHSNKCAHVVDASQADGALVQQRYCYQPRNQFWRIVPSSVAGGYVELRAWHSDKCLGVRGGSYDNGALIHQWSCNGARSQQWLRVSAGSGWYQLRALHSGKCLDVQYGSQADGAPLQQWECNSQPQQIWRFV